MESKWSEHCEIARESAEMQKYICINIYLTIRTLKTLFVSKHED